MVFSGRPLHSLRVQRKGREMCIRDRVYIAHVTCREALKELIEARGNGVNINGETCTHYLTITKDVLDNPDSVSYTHLVP